MERLHCIYLFADDLEVAGKALKKYLRFADKGPALYPGERGRLKEQGLLDVIHSAQAKVEDWGRQRKQIEEQSGKHSDNYLLTDSEITAILNGIELLHYDGDIRLYSNERGDEKYRMLRTRLQDELKG